jgi:hypothetical protein
MKCSKRSFAIVSLVFAVLLSPSIGTLRVSGCLPGLHPIHLYWFRTRMTDVPFATVSDDASAQPQHSTDSAHPRR